MKKRIKNFGGIFLLGAALTACITDQNEDFSQLSQEKGVEVRGKTLSFADFESYENAIQDPKEILSLDFQSIAKLTKTESASSNARILSDEESKALEEYQGSLILEILDEDRMVIIEDKLFYLDFVNRLVLVTPDLSMRESLKNGEYNSNDLYIFSFEDEVIELIEKGSKGSQNGIDLDISKSQRISAEGTNCDWDECRYDDNTPGDNGYEYRIEAKHVYQSSGIYFKLFSQAKHMKRNSPPLYSGEPTEIRIYWNYWFKSKKNSIGTQSDIDNDSKWNDVYEETHYSNSRGLESFRLDSRFYVEVGGNHGDGAGGFGFWDFDLYRIDKGF